MLVAIDIETATPSAGAICAVGVAVLGPGGSVRSRTWLIQPPGNRYAANHTWVHGLSARDTRDAPAFSDVWSSILRFLPPVTHVLAHNAAPVERRHLSAALTGAGRPLPRWTLACTLQASRVLKPRWRSHGLASLAERFGIELDHHDPESDARACVLVARRLGMGRRLTSFTVPWS